MEKNTRAFLRQMKKSMNETAIKDYNQLKVRVVCGSDGQMTLQSILRDFGGSLIYCTDANM